MRAPIPICLSAAALGLPAGAPCLSAPLTPEERARRKKIKQDRRNQRRPAPGVVVPGDIRAREGIDPHPDENLFHQLAQRGGRIGKQALATGRRKIDE